jgi:hypothetical protein
MRFTDQLATNLFARLFTYSPRSEERSELENYCTEALAWCLITQQQFATAFLDTTRRRLKQGSGPVLRRFAGELQVDTQIGFNGEDLLQAASAEEDENDDNVRYERGGIFDLLLSSGERNGFLIAIESKVKLDPGLPGQIKDYRRALGRKAIQTVYNSFSEPYVLTLTPSMAENTDSNGHLSWGDIHALIRQHAQSEKTPGGFSAFAEFLDSRHLSRVDIPPLTRDLRQNLAKSAPFFEKVKGLFDRFANDRILRTFFRPFALLRPTVGFDVDENIAWYGVWDTRNERWAYAGFFITSDLTGLYVDTEYPGERRDECAKLGKAAKAALEEANRLIPQGKSRGSRGTWLRFACELKPEIMESKESSDYYLQWFTEILSEVKQVFG